MGNQPHPIQHNYIHYIHPKLTQLPINKNKEKFNIYSVYFINCLLNENYMEWATNQINLVKNHKIIYVVAVLKKENEKYFREKVSTFHPNIIIECYYKEEFEYRGILKVWELGKIYNNRNDILLYFHSKGISHRNHYNNRDPFNIIFKDINLINEIFYLFPTIEKCGYSSGGTGWIWFNFWYARGSYINKIEKPIKTTHRYYYESWLGKKRKKKNSIHQLPEDNEEKYECTLNNCYNLYTTHASNIGNIGYSYNPVNRKFSPNPNL